MFLVWFSYGFKLTYHGPGHFSWHRPQNEPCLAAGHAGLHLAPAGLSVGAGAVDEAGRAAGHLRALILAILLALSLALSLVHVLVKLGLQLACRLRNLDQ